MHPLKQRDTIAKEGANSSNISGRVHKNGKRNKGLPCKVQAQGHKGSAHVTPT
jgi:hypothetical protein